MTDKIAIDRETLAGMVYPPKPPPRYCGYIPDGSGVNWNAYDTMQMEAYARVAYADGFAAALAAPLAEAQPVAKVASKHGDPERFGEREIRVLADLRKIPYGTKLYAAQPAPAAVPLTDEQRNDCIEAWSSRGWGDRLGEVVRICIAIERAHGIAAAGDKP